MVYHSHFLDYLCWKYPWPSRGDFFGELKKAYTQPEIFQKHTQDLQQIIDHTQKNQGQMAVIIFPYMQAVSRSNFYTQPIGDFFRAQNIPVLDLQPVLQKYEPDKLIVNNNDAHPNEFVHHLTADTLLPFLKHEGLIK